MIARLLAITAKTRSVAIRLDATNAVARLVEDAELEVRHVFIDPLQLIGSARELVTQQKHVCNEGSAQERETVLWDVYERWRVDHPEVSRGGTSRYAKAHWVVRCPGLTAPARSLY